MKLILFLALCAGIACCAASATCTDEEYDKCLQPEPFDPTPVLQLAPLTEEELLKYCSVSVAQIECLYNHEKSCGNGDELLKNYEMYKKIFNLICNKKNSFRQKYLHNARCLRKIMRETGKQCSLGVIPVNVSRKERCKQLNAALTCSKKYANKKCGKDAETVFTEIYGSTFKFYALRSARCL